ncbi:MAG: hypothetical protein N4A49_04725 [Marinifilaceae bacterium]|jgi:PKD repeat protein|nr:hypothetical protein [Marinifilaceae bacterium]
MKNFFYYLFFISVVLYSCSDEDDDVNLLADFSVEVKGEAPDAEILISNMSSGAASYSWTFGEGANIKETTEQTPTAIKVDKAGEITIKLTVQSGLDSKEIEKTVKVEGVSAIQTYKDVEFGLEANSSYGRIFSFDDGIIYKDSEISEDNGSKMHLAFGHMGGTMYFFESASAQDYNVPNATVTKVINYEDTPTFTVSAFEALNNESSLIDLKIENADDSFGNSNIPGIVLFELASGKKGLIHTKEVNSERILVDIKIQKY